MKAPITLLASVFSLATIALLAAEPAGSQPSAQFKSGALPYGVEDVLKLSKAQISEDVIVKYVQNSGIVYNFSPDLIVHLRNEGVSDRVVNAMLEQGKNVAATTTHWQDTQPPRTAQTTQQQAPAPAPQPQPAPTYTQPPQPDPQPAPVSTVHVIPYYPATYAAPYWPGYYGSYWGWSRPRISLGFGFGFGHHHSHFRSFGCW